MDFPAPAFSSRRSRRGGFLADAITALPEYYLPRAEAAIFAAYAEPMAALQPVGSTLVDLGAGSCAKAARLLAVFRPARYVAVDISTYFLREWMVALPRRYPGLDMVGVGMDFSSSFALPPELGDAPDCPPVMFYPGSSIGNFTPAEALRFLGQLRAASHGGGLLIGVGLVKPIAILEAAYDDPMGVTAAFNRNLLRHINRLAETDFLLGRLAPRRLFQRSGFAHRDAP